MGEGAGHLVQSEQRVKVSTMSKVERIVLT
jgi:hypothetical protein